MEGGTRRLLQIFLLVAVVLAGIRVLIIFHSRHAPEPEKKAEPALNADYYVVPKKLHAYDVNSLKELTKGPAWVREGYRYVIYPYSGRADWAHPAGTLGPIEKLNIVDIATQRSPGETMTTPSGQKVRVVQDQVLAILEKDGRKFALPIGIKSGGDVQSFADDILFIQDPRELYKHWSADVWDAVSKHEVKPGMNELQASFSVGFGTLEKDSGGSRVLNYQNGGKPVQVTYVDGHATDVKPGQTADKAAGE